MHIEDEDDDENEDEKASCKPRYQTL